MKATEVECLQLLMGSATQLRLVGQYIRYLGSGWSGGGLFGGGGWREEGGDMGIMKIIN